MYCKIIKKIDENLLLAKIQAVQNNSHIAELTKCCTIRYNKYQVPFRRLLAKIGVDTAKNEPDVEG